MHFRSVLLPTAFMTIAASMSFAMGIGTSASASVIARTGHVAIVKPHAAQASNTPAAGQPVLAGGAVPAVQSACPAYSLCLWQNINFNDNAAGSFWSYSFFTNPDATWDYVGPRAEDQASSLFNNRDLPTVVSDSLRGEGLQQGIAPDTEYSNLTNNFWPPDYTKSMNDTIASFYFCETDSCPGA